VEVKNHSNLHRPGVYIATYPKKQTLSFKKPWSRVCLSQHCEAQFAGDVVEIPPDSTRISRIPLYSSNSLNNHHKSSLRSPSTHHQIVQNAIPCNIADTITNISSLFVQPTETLSKQCQGHYEATATKDSKATSEPFSPTEKRPRKTAYDNQG
jgi:hypothetical protein